MDEDTLSPWNRSPHLRPFAFLAGVVVYWLSKHAAALANLHRKPLVLDPQTRRRIHLLLPEVDLSNLRIVPGAWLPAWLFHRSIIGMAYKDRIYVSASGSLDTYDAFLLLVHELVHILQFQRLGELRFAGEYGCQFLYAGGYGKGMPLEAEAYGFVDHFRGCTFDPRFYASRHMPLLDTTHPHWEYQALAHFLDHGLRSGLASHPAALHQRLTAGSGI
ncbi:MAG: hypothetical protein IPK50_02820 [Fibrobacterota bacterium]|nr:hypothetical protein [Fibrobacterota bacterium]QQS05830.1 MAG: hypothetical protein IPK50_02820 [Fibrobacterota bacterium]